MFIHSLGCPNWPVLASESQKKEEPHRGVEMMATFKRGEGDSPARFSTLRTGHTDAHLWFCYVVP